MNKKMPIYTALLVALTLIPTLMVAHAATHYPLLSATPGGAAWTFETDGYSGKDVTVTAADFDVWYYTGDTLIDTKTIDAMSALRGVRGSPKKVTVLFAINTLQSLIVSQMPAGATDFTVETTRIFGNIVGGDTVVATGLGFFWYKRWAL